MTFGLKVMMILSAVGAVFLKLLGGWDTAMMLLIILITVDFITGIMVAALGRSPKTATGGLSSNRCFVGLCRKITIIGLIMVCNIVDMYLNTSFVRDGAIIGFAVNEMLSLFENAGLLGLKLPVAVTNVIDILKPKEEQIK